MSEINKYNIVEKLIFSKAKKVLFKVLEYKFNLYRSKMMEAKYEVSQQMAKQLDNIFTYHPPILDQPSRYVQLRDAAKELALLIVTQTPPSREQSLAITHLEQSIFFSNAAIARHETLADSVEGDK